MGTTGTQNPNTYLIDKDSLSKLPPGFQFRESSFEDRVKDPDNLARLIASGFLKYASRAKRLEQQDDVNSFLEMHQFHEELCQLAQCFLNKEVPFVLKNRPINDLLPAFASYRLTRASQLYYFKSLEDRYPQQLQDLKALIIECQQDLDNILQSL